MKKIQTMNILAVSLGTSKTGVAILQGNELTVWETTLLTREDLKTHTRLHHMNSLLEFAVLQYPMLRPEYIKEKGGKTHYHMKMFEAVVAADLSKVAVRK